MPQAEQLGDVTASSARTSESYRLAIYRRHALGVTPSRGSEQVTLSRAIDALMHDLNFKARRTTVPLDGVEEDDIERQRYEESA